MTRPQGRSPYAAPTVVIYSAPFFPSIGGMEEFSRNLALGLHALGCPVEVVTDTPMVDDGAQNPFPFPVHRTTAMADKAVLFGRAEVVVFTGVRLREIVMAIPLRQRLIITHHGTYMAKGRPRTFVTGLAKRLVSRLFPNVSVSGYVAGKIGGRQKVIHNCFDDSAFSADGPAGTRSNAFVFCGRLVSDKGCALAVRALAEVRRSDAAATLTIIGDGPEKAELIALAKDIGVADAVVFAGALASHDVAERLRAHRCMVVPSVWEEPFGIVVLEALACGCEVVASNRGGLPEALGSSGWVVAPTIEELAAAMLRVSQGESRRGAGVTEWLEAHTRGAIARQYLDEIRARLA